MADTDTNAIYKTESGTCVPNGSPDGTVVGQDGSDNAPGEPPKKKRRVAKPNPDKKFECKHEGCGKSYSRAEHLYRHQLNRESLLHLP